MSYPTHTAFKKKKKKSKALNIDQKNWIIDFSESRLSLFQSAAVLEDKRVSLLRSEPKVNHLLLMGEQAGLWKED